MDYFFNIVLIISIVILIIALAFILRNNKINLTPLDAVITYVDFDDPEFKKEFKKYKPNKNSSIEASKVYRFKSNDEIKYNIISINKYANFFDNIYLVVSSKNQIPKNLPPSKIPLKIVLHEDFFINKSHLPTFNSTSIETNLHNIKGLSRFYVYFNDDCMFGNYVTKHDFLVLKNKKVKPLINLEEYVLSKRGIPNNKELGFYSSWKNTNRMLDTIFPSTSHHKRRTIKHIPQIQDKLTHKKLRNLFPKEFEITSSSKFRNTKIHNTSAGLAEYYEIYRNAGVNIKNDDYIQAYISNNTLRNAMFFNRIFYKRPKFINIQSTITKSEIALDQIKLFFKSYYSF